MIWNLLATGYGNTLFAKTEATEGQLRALLNIDDRKETDTETVLAAALTTFDCGDKDDRAHFLAMFALLNDNTNEALRDGKPINIVYFTEKPERKAKPPKRKKPRTKVATPAARKPNPLVLFSDPELRVKEWIITFFSICTAIDAITLTPEELKVVADKHFKGDVAKWFRAVENAATRGCRDKLVKLGLTDMDEYPIEELGCDRIVIEYTETRLIEVLKHSVALRKDEKRQLALTKAAKERKDAALAALVEKG